MQLVLVNTPAKIRATFTGGDGEAVAPSSPTVTVVRDSDNEEIVSGDSADVVDDKAVYTFNPADLPGVDRLEATFTEGATSAVVEVEIVGGFLCSLEAISDASEQTDPEILRGLRETAERRLEDACGVAFRPRYARETLLGDGTTELLLRRPRPLSVIAATLDGDDVLAELSPTSGGTVTRSAGFPCGAELDIAYAHGWGSCPEPISQAAVKFAATLAENADDRIQRFREDDQEVWLTVPGTGGALTSIPEVNAAIEAYRIPLVA